MRGTVSVFVDVDPLRLRFMLIPSRLRLDWIRPNRKLFCEFVSINDTRREGGPFTECCCKVYSNWYSTVTFQFDNYLPPRLAQRLHCPFRLRTEL